MAKVNRGEWHARATRRRPTRAATQSPTFQVVGLGVAAPPPAQGRRSGRARRRTIRRPRAGASRLVMDKFGPVPVDRVDYALADELVTELCEERLAIERARELGAPLMRTQVNPRTGRPATEARRRGLSNTSIRQGARRRPSACCATPRSAACIAGERSRPEVRRPEGRAPAALLPGAAPHCRAAPKRPTSSTAAAGRGLDWHKVDHIRQPDKSGGRQARTRVGVSDVLIGKVRRGQVWRKKPTRAPVIVAQRRAIVGRMLVLAGPRISRAVWVA